MGRGSESCREAPRDSKLKVEQDLFRIRGPWDFRRGSAEMGSGVKLQSFPFRTHRLLKAVRRGPEER